MVVRLRRERTDALEFLLGYAEYETSPGSTYKGKYGEACRHKRPVIIASLIMRLIDGGTLPKPMRVVMEIGPKRKKMAAFAPDWPGLERGGKTGEEAVGRLVSYIPRYAVVAQLAGMQNEFKKYKTVQVVERFTGPGSTDFWGISFGFSKIDKQTISVDELERQLKLLRACWKFFDKVLSRVSAKLQKGPRGGGRDRDEIVRHIFINEQDWVKKIGVITPDKAMGNAAGMKTHRDSFCKAVREFHAQDQMARKWPLQYLIRHTAYHTLDHAWEMEDKDLGKRG